MFKKLEQASEGIAEDNLPETKVPTYVSLCETLLEKTPDSQFVNVRCFYTVDGKVFLGVLFAETEDSFLVGAPVRLIMRENRNIQAEPLGSEPVIRWMKSATLYVAGAQPRSKYYYYTFLRDNGRIHLPDYLTKERLAEINDYIEETESQPNNSVGIASIDAKKEVTGGSSKSFRPLTVSEKIH